MRNRRSLAYAALLLCLLALGGLVWKWGAIRARAEVGAAYGARVTCSCRYVESRSMASCSGDTEPGMEIVSIADLPGQQAVRASVPLIAERTARFKRGFGCLVDPP